MSTLVVLKTKYASIEQMFPTRIEAAIFLKNALVEMEVLSYEIRSLK